MEGIKPEFWIDDKGYIYRVSDEKPWHPIYWIDKNYIYPLPNKKSDDKELKAPNV